ncbi:heptaprenyl diphosphate synthase component 1 [Sporosarcina beigongshangi]|uniref:heptaprenyl diphosphate synthase component 1 n=1 Tax=Sporosarcina beigongshangi TaxID=2782538 RepID=UPI00193A73A3|nr:heptaprenyl diphosphate synthase component 1 [Sporosarcina beigongshangi]
MERQKIKQHIENYINDVEHSLSEPIVDRDVGRLPIDAAKAFFLLLPLLNGERWTDHVHTAAIAVGAVHAAFDAHDAIDVSDATSKQQQLTVLSGDHYSGIHYRLLASIPKLDFIQSLSRTIGHINEVKTALHLKVPDEPARLVEAIRIIEAGCITDFLHTFGFSQYAKLANIVLPLLWMEKEDVALTSSEVALQLHAELRDVLQAADFLEPFLQEEIRKLALPLLGKPN